VFQKRATIQVSNVIDAVEFFSRRRASTNASETTLIDLKQALEKYSSTYNLSSRYQDYAIASATALDVGVSNYNGDAFPRDEVLRYDPSIPGRIFQSFNGCPIHVEHYSAQPRLAKGLIIDSQFVDRRGSAPDNIDVVFAVDKTKDSRFVDEIVTGAGNTFSMGAYVAYTICNVCENIASTPAQFCDHIAQHKLKRFGDRLSFEWCYGCRYYELSKVKQPAFPNAAQRGLLVA